MTQKASRKTAASRLRASPNFMQALTFDGKPYVAKDSEPYIQYWLSERDRVLLAMFCARRGVTAIEAMEAYFRVTCTAKSAPETRRLVKAIEDMRAAQVLVDPGADTSRYTARIVDDYVAHRPFPRRIADHVIERGGIGKHSRVLDLAGGPGDLSLMLAQTSDAVSLMELSSGFIKAAARRAKKIGVKLTTLHESCNRLVYRDDSFDVITVSQALHWLDDVTVCRGVCRLLQPGGSFFVIHSAIELEDAHPLAYILGHDSILGRKARQSFAAEVAPLLRRLTLLFDALDAPDVQRVDQSQRLAGAGSAPVSRIVPAGVAFFRQRRPFGPGYARGFLTPQHIEVSGQTEAAFWQDLEARCSAATPEDMLGTHQWAVLQFRRGGARVDQGALEECNVTEIGFEQRPAV
jgi:2-polyprenyl-3-methyl-5-hydroxy-6-metoxy-1,4-benzoquinol methylase